MAADGEVIAWLMDGDPSIRWQVMRDLLDAPNAQFASVRATVATEGWGAQLLALQQSDGSWGRHPYAKWNGTFYTMLVLGDLGLVSDHEGARRAAHGLLNSGYRPNGGGIRFGTTRTSDPGETCVSGMGMAICARYHDNDARLDALHEYLLREQMPDGGWNCRFRTGANHSSFHTTISVLEGLLERKRRSADPGVDPPLIRGHEFLFEHSLFRSHRRGTVVNSEFKKLHFPPRWHYDVLRGLEHLRAAGARRDLRLKEPIELIRAARRPDGRWNLNAPYRGQESVLMERAGMPSRWNTLRCLRVLRWWELG